MFLLSQTEVSGVIYKNRGNTPGEVMELQWPTVSSQLCVTQGGELGLSLVSFPSSLHSLSPFQSTEPRLSCWKKSPQDTARRRCRAEHLCPLRALLFALLLCKGCSSLKSTARSCWAVILCRDPSVYGTHDIDTALLGK